MKGLLNRLFGKEQPAATAGTSTPPPRLSVNEFAERLLRIDELDFVGQFSRSPAGRYRLCWSDRNPEGTIGGHRSSGHGRWVLLHDDRFVASGPLERPQDGKVSDDGTFILNDWLFGDGLNGRFVAYRPNGEEILSRDIAANLLDNGLSADGRLAICQTAHAPGSPDNRKFMLYDLAAATEIARWEPETGWVERYEFDTVTRRVYLVHRESERVGYGFDGRMIDRGAWQARRVANGDLHVIRSLLSDAGLVRDTDVMSRIFVGLDLAAVTGDIRDRAQAWRLKGEIHEQAGDAQAALSAYDQAIALDPQVGASRRAEKLRKALSPIASADRPRKLGRFERQAERLGIEHEAVVLEAGEAKLWRHNAGDPWSTVEEAALSHYVAEGWSGAAAEGGLILTLIKAASFTRLPARNADTFIEALYSRNVAFDEDRFEPGLLIETIGRATHEQLERNWAVIATTTGDSPAFYPRVRWAHVRGLFNALGAERLAAIARLFAEAPYDLRAGWPDLTLWRDEEVRFAEVKGPSDSMHASQARLIAQILKPLGFRVTLAEAKPV